MAKMVLVKSENKLTFTKEEGSEFAFECRTDFFPGENEFGQPRAAIPDGEYLAYVDMEYAGDEVAFGPAFINVDTERGRGIHGGGTGLDDPFAWAQGWMPTHGCGRMQNGDLMTLVSLMRAEGGAVDMEVRE